MIQITLRPSWNQHMTDKSWDYLHSLHAFIKATPVASLMEFAVKLDKFLTNIDSDKVWIVAYKYNKIDFWHTVDWYGATQEGMHPFMSILEVRDSI